MNIMRNKIFYLLVCGAPIVGACLGQLQPTGGGFGNYLTAACPNSVFKDTCLRGFAPDVQFYAYTTVTMPDEATLRARCKATAWLVDLDRHTHLIKYAAGKNKLPSQVVAMIQVALHHYFQHLLEKDMERGVMFLRHFIKSGLGTHVLLNIFLQDYPEWEDEALLFWRKEENRLREERLSEKD